jgi:hypothetical protein
VYGNSIVACDPVLPGGMGIYNVSCTVHDPGYYVVQVMLTSVEGESRSQDLTVELPYLVNRVIYTSQHLLHITGATSFANDSLCNSSSDSGSGRWQYRPEGLEAAHITDILGLNVGYVWVPYSCHYHIYSPDETFQCFKKHNYSVWAFNADSIGREMMQNIQMILTHFDPSTRIPKLKGGGPSWTEAIMYDDNEMPIYLCWGSFNENTDVAVDNFGLAHALATGQPISTLVSSHVANLQHFVEGCSKKTKCVYYVHPSVQREADHVVNRLVQRSFYEQITGDKMRVINSAAKNQLKGSGVMLLMGDIITEAHWYGSWDGLHYSEMYEHYVPGDPRWYGGVSMMITQVLINQLCGPLPTA